MKSYVPLDSLLCVRGCIKSRSKDIANLLFLYIFIRNFDSFSLFFLFNISICLHRMRCGLIIEIFHSYPTMNVEDIFSRRYISSIRENENVVVVFFLFCMYVMIRYFTMMANSCERTREEKCDFHIDQKNKRRETSSRKLCSTTDNFIWFNNRRFLIGMLDYCFD